MHFGRVVLLALTAVCGTGAASNCKNNNNCLRALLGGKTRDAYGDCMSYLAVTVTPATAISTLTSSAVATSLITQTTTISSTTTATSTAIEILSTTKTTTIYTTPLPNKRLVKVRQNTVSPTDIPAYASPCSGAVKYSSACSCIGATGHTVTVATAHSTAYTTTTSTSTSTTLATTVSAVTSFTTTTSTTVTVSTSTTLLPAVCNARGLPGPNAFNYDANFNTNQADCIASCKTDNRCYATGFYIVTDPGSGTQTGTCRKYDKPVADSADLGFGYYNFNDKFCPS